MPDYEILKQQHLNNKIQRDVNTKNVAFDLLVYLATCLVIGTDHRNYIVTQFNVHAFGSFMQMQASYWNYFSVVSYDILLVYFDDHNWIAVSPSRFSHDSNIFNLQCEARFKKFRVEGSIMSDIRSHRRAQRHWNKVQCSK